MNNKKSNIGQKMHDAIQEGLNTGDFKYFNQLVSDTVSEALGEVKRKASHVSQSFEWQNSHTRYKTEESSNGTGRSASSLNGEKNGQVKQLPAIKTRKVGEVASVLYMTFGGIGIGVGSIMLVILLSVGVLGWPLTIFGGLALGSFAMVKNGVSKRKRLKRAARYVQICGKNAYVDIDVLAAHTGQKVRKVLNDVKQMIRIGIFPEGHLDDEQAVLMLSDTVFKEYIDLQKQRKALEIEQKAAVLKNRNKKKNKDSEQIVADAVKVEDVSETEEHPDPDIAQMIRDGKGFIKRIRTANDEIPGEVISNKLYELERLLEEIFSRVQEHPEEKEQMRKFMNYYLPTTLKLVEAYAEFDRVSVPGEDILSAKAEIEKALDTINQAFGELLNKLFKATVYDVTTDAQVLQTMLAKEGLTKDEISGR